MSSLGMVSASANIASSSAISMAALASKGEFGLFAGANAQNLRYNSGSHVDVKGVNLVAGISKNVDDVVVGAFMEFGKGSYDSFNGFKR